MKSFAPQPRKGFMLMEVMIAMALAGILLTAILSLQMAVFRRVILNAKEIERIGLLKQSMVENQMAFLGKEDGKDFQERENVFFVEYFKKQISSGLIAQRFEGMTLETVSGSWQEWDAKKEIQLSQIIFIPIKPEKKESSKKGKS